jgi:ABC-type glutathione transport system ATPase component
MPDPLLAVEQLTKSYTRSDPVLKGINFHATANETVGLVGVSGAGKSTIGRILCGLEEPDSGSIVYDGFNLPQLRGAQRREATRSIQMIFQDPYESLSPRMKIGDLIAEPLRIQKRYRSDKAQLRQLVCSALADVSLDPERYFDRYPHELSGGERQRVGLARAFICRPKLIIADEPTSMLDSSLRLDLLQLMEQLRRRDRTCTLFITHDLALTYRFCDRLIVLDRGVIVESGNPKQIIDHPEHPFTRKLIAALMELHHFAS